MDQIKDKDELKEELKRLQEEKKKLIEIQEIKRDIDKERQLIKKISPGIIQKIFNRFRL